LTFDGMRAVTRFFLNAGFVFAVRQKRVATESLHIAFGEEKNNDEIKQIFRNCFENVGKGMIELIYFMDHPKLIKQQIVYEGKEHLDRALQAGNGAIAVSAHFGNFPLMLLNFAQEGHKISAIIRPTRDKIIEKYFQDQRTRMGLNTIYSLPRKKCVDDSIRALRNNEIVFIPLDQNFGSGGGVYVDFFGRKAATATGPVIFARRTDAPILPMFIVRQKDDTHKVIIEPPLELINGEDDKDAIEQNTAGITRVIERYIRQYPQEWGWMHRRWKSQPPQTQENVIYGSEI
jgi:KDO2-lipid IV(A) lauroyltransferase